MKRLLWISESTARRTNGRDQFMRSSLTKITLLTASVIASDSNETCMSPCTSFLLYRNMPEMGCHGDGNNFSNASQAFDTPFSRRTASPILAAFRAYSSSFKRI